MIELKGGHKLCQTAGDLPDLRGAKLLFLDGETTQAEGAHGRKALHPYLGDRFCGVGLTVDDSPVGWYVPVRHKLRPDDNVPLEAFQRWVRDLMSSVGAWVNHDVKFDAGFLSVGEGVEPPDRMICTLTMAKLHHSDRMEYGLKPLSRDWLEEDIEERERVDAYLEATTRQKHKQDFGRTPVDLMGEYAIEDVMKARRLYHWLEKRRPAEMDNLWETEIRLTSVLFDMEREGLLASERDLKVENVRCLRRVIEVSDELTQLTGQEWVDSNKNLFDVFTNQLGLPVLAYTEKRDKLTGKKTSGGPSYDKDALKLYQRHPSVTGNPRAREVVDLVLEYRTEAKFSEGFLTPYLHLTDENGYLHPTYNQVVRTGRMSSRRPNGQQLNARAKRLIIPGPGNAFLSADASQVEFRLIAHYIQDEAAIRAYRENPDTDFHKWVAELCDNIRRQSGKRINFAVSYGAGKYKVTSELAGEPEIIEAVTAIVEQEISDGTLDESARPERFKELCMRKASAMYETYHERLPGLRRVSKAATSLCKTRGWVKNAFGRRRHLPEKAAHNAFNSVIQGCAMDYIKDRMVALAPRYNERIRAAGLAIVANVHDEVLFRGPQEAVEDPELQRYIRETLEYQSVPFAVPFTWDIDTSRVNWKEAVA